MILRPPTKNYQRKDLPRVSLVNLYPEESLASATGVALLARPALSKLYTLGSGPIRGIFKTPGALSGSTFAVSGGLAYNGETSIGAVSGSNRVSMASSTTQLIIANDDGLRITTGGALADVTFPDGAGVVSCEYINGYFIAVRENSQRFYWSTILDGSLWDALDFASAERGPDNIVCVKVVSDQIWFFGETTIEVWITTGDGEIPFQRVEGRLFDKGCRARDTVARFDNSVIWVGNDGIVYRGDSNPVRISDFSVEEAIKETDASILRAWTFPWNGHLFYALSTVRGTQIYDAATQEWFVFASYGKTLWRAHLGVAPEESVIAGDNETGDIWTLLDQPFSMDEPIIEAKWTTMIDQEGFLDNLSLDMSTGKETDLTAEPIVEVRVSRDQGETYSDYRGSSIGKTGQYRKRAVFRRFGMVDGDGMMLDFRITDPTMRRISALKVNEGQGGRGRPSA